MRPLEDVSAVLELSAQGHSASAIAQRTGIPRGTVRDWVSGRTPKRHVGHDGSCQVCGGVAHRYAELPPAYVYLLGLYLGDGCISAHPRGVYKLRINLDLRYPGIVGECEQAIRTIDPDRRVHRLKRRSNYTGEANYTHVEVSAYWKGWVCVFPQHGPGRKHHRRIELVEWQSKLVDAHPELLLRGLVHSDGCRFINTGRKWRHPRYSFSNRSDDILGIFRAACDRMGLHWTNAGHTVYVSRKADVAVLDRFIGPKA
jgi:hypothetical protein